MDAYIFQAALICTDCCHGVQGALIKPAHVDMHDESSYDSGEWPKGPYSVGGGESDTPAHCDMCGVFLDNPLTGDGENYVLDAFREYVANGRGRVEVLIEWKDAYPGIWDHYEDVSVSILLEEQEGGEPGQEERFKRLAGS